MPGRTYSATSSYRYGFNGKENDNEVKGEGNQQDYGMRVYDPRLGRFLSFDPLAKSYPWYTPYQFAGNSPLQFIDLDGGEPKDPANNDLILPSYANITGTNTESNAGNVAGTNIQANAAEGSVNKFSIGDRTFEARYNSASGKFTRYLDQNGKPYDASDFFEIQENSSWSWRNFLNRGAGLLQGIGGVAEMVVGGGALAAPEPTGATKVGGWLLVIHGADNATAGFGTCFSGKSKRTYTEKAFIAVGMSPTAASTTNAILGLGGSGFMKYGNPFTIAGPITMVKEIEITEASIARALEGSNMQTLQPSVSLPAVKRYYEMLRSGSASPAIKVADNIIIDGNHRYIAGRLFGIEPPVIPGSLPSSMRSSAKPIQEIKIDLVDWLNF